MIKVFQPPGCYATYFARCLYNYTNLRARPFGRFTVDQNGSSHQHRYDTVAQTLIKVGHLDTLSQQPGDKIVTIYPVAGHELDYYNNQFFKHEKGQLISYILTNVTEQEAEHKLKDYWNYSGKFDETTPRWILREWCSFWIADTLQVSYSVSKYQPLNSIVQLTTRDIFENFLDTLNRATAELELTINIDVDIINTQHNEFLVAQKFHNSQQRCNRYVQDLIANKNTKMVTHSIFDEAYIQHLLRKHNLEIRCDGLDIFPSTTHELKLLTYENSDHSN